MRYLQRFLLVTARSYICQTENIPGFREGLAVNALAVPMRPKQSQTKVFVGQLGGVGLTFSPTIFSCLVSLVFGVADGTKESLQAVRSNSSAL